MNLPIVQLLVLAGIAVFLILKLRSVLGTREGYERPPEPLERRRGPDLSVIEGGPDADITDNVPENSNDAKALIAMKGIDRDFSVNEFLKGARGAYEMILMAFERGELADVQPFISEEVYDAFDGVVADRAEKGLTVEAEFIGVSDMRIHDVEFDRENNEAEISVKFIGEMTYQLRDRGGDVIDGDKATVKKQKDIWTFARVMGSDDPNWILVATGE